MMLTTVISIAFLVPAASAACFYPDGSVAQDTPCTDSTTQSSCCGTGYACLGHSSSFFLCQATGAEFQKPGGGSRYVRGSCTDKAWRSSNCPNVCVDPRRDNTDGGNGIAPCPRSDTAFYCISAGLGLENCSTGFNIVNFLMKPSILTTIGIALPTSSTAIPSRAATSASTTASAGATKPAETTPGSPSSPSNNGTTIGVAVGVSVGGLGLIAGALATWLLVRKKRRPDPVPSDMAAVHENQSRNLSATYELNKQPTLAAPSEAPADEQVTRYELPSSMDSRPRNH